MKENRHNDTNITHPSNKKYSVILFTNQQLRTSSPQQEALSLMIKMTILTMMRSSVTENSCPHQEKVRKRGKEKERKRGREEEKEKEKEKEGERMRERKRKKKKKRRRAKEKLLGKEVN